MRPEALHRRLRLRYTDLLLKSSQGFLSRQVRTTAARANRPELFPPEGMFIVRGSRK